MPSTRQGKRDVYESSNLSLEANVFFTIELLFILCCLIDYEATFPLALENLDCQ